MNRKTQWILILCLILIAACLIGLLVLRHPQGQTTPETTAADTPKYPQKTSDSVTDANEPTEGTQAPREYVSPVDFDQLRSVNPDIYAWLEIPNTEISYPLLQSSEDDSYYLDRGSDGTYDYDGSLYTEATYNNREFTDPVTVVYGHNKRDGKMFSNLQLCYSGEQDMTDHSEIIVYLPERELHFTVFAAVPFDNRHILYNYDFTEERTFRLFFQSILSVHAMTAVYADDALVQPDEQVLILSTCLEGNRAKRYLVCAKLAATLPEDIHS